MGGSGRTELALMSWSFQGRALASRRAAHMSITLALHTEPTPCRAATPLMLPQLLLLPGYIRAPEDPSSNAQGSRRPDAAASGPAAVPSSSSSSSVPGPSSPSACGPAATPAGSAGPRSARGLNPHAPAQQALTNKPAGPQLLLGQRPPSTSTSTVTVTASSTAAAQPPAPKPRPREPVFFVYFVPRNTLSDERICPAWLDRRMSVGEKRKGEERDPDLATWRADALAWPRGTLTGIAAADEPRLAYRGYWDPRTSAYGREASTDVRQPICTVKSVPEGSLLFYVSKPLRKGASGRWEPVAEHQHANYLKECHCTPDECGKLE